MYECSCGDGYRWEDLRTETAKNAPALLCTLAYRSLGYFDVVSEATEASMRLAVREIQELPHYQESREVHLYINKMN